MKKQIRLLGIDDAAFDKFNDSHVIVIGTIFRGGEFMDGVLTCKVKTDGDDATEKIASMINNSKFKVQLKAIMLDGIAVAGFNVIDVSLLYEKTNIPVIVVMRDYPKMEEIKNALKKLDMEEKIKLLSKAGEITPFNKIHYQSVGLSKENTEEILKISCTHSYVPEPIRIAHLIGAGLTFGESKGRA